MAVRLDGPDLFDGVREAVVVADDVEEPAKHGYGDKVHEPEGNFGEDGTHDTGADVIYGDRFQTPVREIIRLAHIGIIKDRFKYL